ncbi:hypothetical protein OROMI_023738 [Orobanche minor]
MATKTLVFLAFLIMSSVLASSSHGRRLLMNEQHNKASILFDGFHLTPLPKGKLTASAPGKKGHAIIIDEKLISRHLRAVDGILFHSVPSPQGKGN